MSQGYHVGFLTRTLPSVFLFILGVLAFVFMVVTSKLNRFDSKTRSADRSDNEEDHE